MDQSYIRLRDIGPNSSLQNPIESVPSNHPNAIEATDKAQLCGFKKHTLVLFCKTFVRCLVTTVIIAFILATMKIYQNMDNFTSHQKTNFNIIITALGLSLGLNFFVSFDENPTKVIREHSSLTRKVVGLVQRLSNRPSMENFRSIRAPPSKRPDSSYGKRDQRSLAWMELSLDSWAVHFLLRMGELPFQSWSCLCVESIQLSASVWIFTKE